MGFQSQAQNQRTMDKMKREADAIRAKLKMYQIDLDKADAELSAQRMRTQELIRLWRGRLGDAEDKLRRQKVQRDRELNDITAQLLFFENQLKREQSEIKRMIADKNRIIDDQRRKIIELTAANNKLAKAMTRVKQQMHAQTLLGSGMLSPGIPNSIYQDDVDVNWDINNEVFDVDQFSISPQRQSGVYRATYRPPLGDSQVYEPDVSPSNLHRTRSLPLLDDDAEPSPVYENVMPDLLPSRDKSRSMELLCDTPRTTKNALSSLHISPPDDLSGAEKRDKVRRGSARLKDVRNKSPRHERSSTSRQLFSYAF